MENKVIEYLIKQLENNKCVLILGPEFINIDQTDRDYKESIHNYLVENKFKEAFRIKNYLKEDGFFFFNDNQDGDRIEKDSMLATVGDFYKDLTVTPSYERLAKIPFNMIISLSPDNLMNRAFDRINKKKTHCTYSARGFDDYPSLPDKDSTLIYNLFGDYENYEDLIFTFDNLFKFLDKIFQDSVFPKFKERISGANSFIFLGFSYDKWYLKLFFFLLTKFRTSSTKGCSKYAIFNYDNDFTDQKIDFFESNFGITFSQEKEKDFIEELYAACDTRGILFKATLPADDPDAPPVIAHQYKILYLASSPLGKLTLRQGEEYQGMKEELNKKWITLLDPRFNIQRNDIQTEVNKNFPSLLYISCHGSREGDLILSDDMNAPAKLSLQALKEIIEHLVQEHKELECIVFSSCKSEIQAKEISLLLPFCIGMSENIDEEASTVFTKGFFEGFIKEQNNLAYAFDNGVGLLKNHKSDLVNRSFSIPVMYHNGEMIRSNHPL
ncbi:SIR2 family protein [Flavitalea flava]